MTIEAEYRALLVAHAGLSALVGARVAEDALAEGSGLPAIVFSATHDRQFSVDNLLMTDQCALATQCWAQTSVEAHAVADQVVAAVAGAPGAAGAQVVDRSATFDPEVGLHGVIVTALWWQLAA